MGCVKKVEANRCIQVAKKSSKEAGEGNDEADTVGQWPKYLFDVTEDERKSG